MLPVDERSTAPFHPYIEQDLRDAVSIPLEDWLHGALRLPKDRLNTWASKIGEMRWFEDEDVLQYLREYCSADKDNLWLHHRAFKQLANEVLDLACGNLPGIRTTGSYPIDDIVFTDTQSRGIGENPEHQQLTAVRRPAVLATRGPVAAQFLETGDMQWTDVLFWWEIQYGGSLKDALEQEKVSRGIKPPGTDKSGRTKKTSSKHSATSRKSQTAAEVGTKRSRADDLLAGDSIDPKMMKHMQSQDSDFDLYAGKNAALRSASYALELLSCTRGTR
ncbi:hypothetical protein NM688_g7633 [Phlebia brevispora]|uniref:Uncharacterized protein n=1 Tax=Phlebia brevispora TaxID=194682 RepID=A0ACC1S2Z5_9APHY|nr:hypothetical protein NM688_g7633 [Phlebia brevispora]